MIRSTYSLVLLFVFSTWAAVNAEPVGWRTDGDGRYPDADPPIHWSPDVNVVWKTAMPSWSNASPVLWAEGGRLFVCSEPDQIMAVDQRDGTILWKDSVGDAVRDEFSIFSRIKGAILWKDSSGDEVEFKAISAHKSNGYTTPTPVTDGERVFSVFGFGAVAAHTVDGELLWARVVQKPQHKWGTSASPVLAGGVLIVHLVDLFGLDPATGAEKWRAKADAKWGSPVVADIGGVAVVITPSGDVFRAADGQRLAERIGRLKFAAPVVQDGVVYFIEKRAQAIALPDSLAADSFPTPVRWTTRIQGSRHYASSVIHEGLVYAISREEMFAVIDANTGEVVYEKRLDLGGGNNSAYPSVTVAGDKLFVGSESGTTAVLALGRTYRELARNSVEGYRSSPVFAGERMYLRAFDYLYCFGPRRDVD